MRFQHEPFGAFIANLGIEKGPAGWAALHVRNHWRPFGQEKHDKQHQRSAFGPLPHDFERWWPSLFHGVSYYFGPSDGIKLPPDGGAR